MTPHALPPNADGQITFSQQWAPLEPDTRPEAGPHDFIYTADFWIQWTVDEDGTVKTFRLRIPKGCRTDIASVPRAVWTLSGLTPDGLYRNAACGHDALYMWKMAGLNYSQLPFGWFQELAVDEWQECHRLWRKHDADLFFLRVMKACGVPKITRDVMYEAVNLGAEIPWLNIDSTREQWRNAFVA